jgi:hypothetical protein
VPSRVWLPSEGRLDRLVCLPDLGPGWSVVSFRFVGFSSSQVSLLTLCCSIGDDCWTGIGPIPRVLVYQEGAVSWRAAARKLIIWERAC